MSDRLLSDGEICKACSKMETGGCDENGPAECNFDDVPRFNRAQDTKTAATVNAEWIAWIESVIIHICNTPKCPYVGNCSEAPLGKDCKLWQERKRSVGL
jgi:hypothetical protein